MSNGITDKGAAIKAFALYDWETGDPGGLTGTGGVELATEETLAGFREDSATPADNLPATLPEPLDSTNAVLGVKVLQVGAGTAAIADADADEIWDVVGWLLSFSAGGTLTASMDSGDTDLQFVFDVPDSGIWSERPGSFAIFTGTLNEAVTFANSAGNMKGIVYVRKHA